MLSSKPEACERNTQIRRWTQGRRQFDDGLKEDDDWTQGGRRWALGRHDTHLLPEETLPRREVGAFEERVLEDFLHAAKGLDDVGSVVVEVPEFACREGKKADVQLHALYNTSCVPSLSLTVVSLMGPPKGVESCDVELRELRANTPAFVVREGVPVLLEERVDAGNAAVPRVLEVLQSQAPVLWGEAR